MRGFPQRVALCLACFIVLVAACQKPGPAPVGPTPDASDAARPVPGCAAACNHYDTVCAGALAICDQTCPGARALDPGYTPCLAGATACMNCDATARAGQTPGGAPHPHGH